VSPADRRPRHRPDDLVALAAWAYRTQRHLTLATLAAALPNGGRADVIAGLPGLLDAGWCLDGDAWNERAPKTRGRTFRAEEHEAVRVLHNGAVWCAAPLERVATCRGAGVHAASVAPQ
jgi:hypothetical protein